MELFLFQSALKDFGRPRRVIAWIIITLFVGAMGVVWHSFAPQVSKGEVYGQVSSTLLFRVVALCSAIFSSSIVSQEVEQKTISYLLTRPIPRYKLLLARYAASTVIVFLIGVLGAVACSAGIYGSHFASNEWMWNDIKAIFMGALAYNAIFLLISLFINRAMIVCLLFAFGWETSIPNLPGQLYYLTIFSYMQAIAAHPEGSTGSLAGLLAGSLGTNTLTSGTAYFVLMVLTAACLAGSCWWFGHFEYVPREDAE